MQKFEFPLENVLKFRNSLLDGLKDEHAKILVELYNQQKSLDALLLRHRLLNEEYNEKSQQGITPLKISVYKQYFKKLQAEKNDQREKIASTEKRERAKQEEIIEAKKKISSLEKLREKRVAEYNTKLFKHEERLIDEFIINKHAVM